jgi:hypothetical protein
MDAEKGKPLAVKALPDFEPDRNVRTLCDIVRAHIDPALFGVEFQPVLVQSGWSLVIRISRS